VKAWLMGGLDISWGGKTMGKLLHHEEMSCPKCAQPKNTMNMEVGESLVANHNFGECFHSRVKEGRGTQPCVKLGKRSSKGRWGR
jgi:hypothetical protein